MFEGPFHIQPVIANAAVRTDGSQPDEEALEQNFVSMLIEKRLHEIKDC